MRGVKYVTRKRNILGVDVSRVLREETLVESVLGTVPEFRLQESVDLMIERLTSHIKTHILQDKSRDPIERSQAIDKAAVVIKEIREEVLELVKEKLLVYSRD